MALKNPSFSLSLSVCSAPTQMEGVESVSIGPASSFMSNIWKGWKALVLVLFDRRDSPRLRIAMTVSFDIDGNFLSIDTNRRRFFSVTARQKPTPEETIEALDRGMYVGPRDTDH
jgi:hypothetical protein